MDNYEEVTKKLATFLKPGHGVLHIIDFYNQDVELTSPSLSPSSSPANEAVRHMGGLKVSALTETCRAAGLTDIIVKKAYDVKFWQQSGFIKNHCDQQTISSLENGTLEKKESIEGEVFLITQTVIMASGRSQ